MRTWRRGQQRGRVKRKLKEGFGVMIWSLCSCCSLSKQGKRFASEILGTMSFGVRKGLFERSLVDGKD